MQGETARRGSTILEIVLVILVLGVLGGVLIFGTGHFQLKARDDQRVQMMKGIAVDLETYRGKKGHYPAVGDVIPGGSVVSASNSFNSVITALGQNKILKPANLVDPAFGRLFGDFNGVDAHEEGAKFLTSDKACQGKTVAALTNPTEVVSYSYYTSDGKTYLMCLLTEQGETKLFVSPKIDYLNL